MPAPTCSPSLPTPCYGRAEARERGIGVWYADDLKCWLWVPEADVPECIVAVTHCPYCHHTLPLMGTARDTKAWLDETLADPEE